MFNLSAAINLQAPSTSQVNKAIQSINYSLDKAGEKAQSFSDIVSLKTTNFAAYAVASTAVLKLTNAISQSVTEAIRLEKEIIKITQVIGVSVKASKSLTSSILEISKTYGVTSVKVAETVRTLTQSGLAFDKARKSAELLAKTTLLATFDSLQSTTEGLVAIFAQFNLSVKDAEISIGAINALSKKYAVESGDLIEAVKRAGGVFSATGGKLEDLLAIFTTVRSTTRESAETIATGLRTIFSRLQRPKTIEYFRELGIELTNLKGQFIGNLPAIQRISQGLEVAGIKAGDVKFAEVVEQLGGIRQAARVIPLLTQQAKLAETVSVANQGLVETDEDVAKAKQTLAFRIDELRAKFSALVVEVSETSSFQALTGTMIGLADSLISVASSLKPLIPLLVAFAGIKIGQGITKGIKGIGKGSASILGFNRGGVVPGSGNGDTVPAMLEPGEFVIRKRAVQAIGTSNLQNINKYAIGGKVSLTGDQLKSTYKGLKNVDEEKKYNAVVEAREVSVKGNNKLIAAMIASKRKNPKKLPWQLFEDGVSYVFKTPLNNQPNSYLDYPKKPGDAKFLKEGATYKDQDLENKAVFRKGNNNETMLAKLVGSGQYSDGKKVTVFYPDNPSQIAAVVKKESTKNTNKFGKAKIPKFAKGGPVGTDTVPALLTPGEFVINKASAKALGYSNLQKINKYAKGGVVGSKNIAEESFGRASGTPVDLSSANKIADNFIKGLGDFSSEFIKNFSGSIENIEVFEKTLRENIEQLKQSNKDTSKLEAILKQFQTARGVQAASGGSTRIGIRLGKATGQTVRHELGHQADTALGRQAGFKGKASQQEGSFQAEITNKMKPLLEDYLKKMKYSNKYINYRLKNEEIFADLMSKATPEVRKILTSTTDAKKGMELLAQAIDANASASRGLGGLTANDIRGKEGGKFNSSLKNAIVSLKGLPGAISNILNVSGGLAIGLSALIKGFGDAESKLAKTLDAFSAEFFKTSALIAGATAAGSAVAPKDTKENKALATKFLEKSSPRVKAGLAVFDKLADVALAAAGVYKAFINSKMAIELETANRLKKEAIEKGNVEEAVNQARNQSDIARAKTESDIATPIFAGIGSIIGGAVATGLNAIAPGLGIILSGPLIKIGGAIGTFLSTFKPLVDFMIQGIDVLIGMANGIISWFGADPFPTLTDTFNKQKALQVERARSDALFNKSVLMFDKSQKDIESSLSSITSGDSAGAGDIQRTQKLLADKLALANNSIDDFTSQLKTEQNKGVNADPSRKQELRTQIDEKIDYFEEGLTETAQFLRQRGKSVKESLESLGASFDQNGNVVLSGVGDLADLQKAYVKQGKTEKDATAATLAFARSLVPATLSVKATADIFEKLSALSRSLLKSRLQGVSNFADFRANVRQTPLSNKQAALESEQVLGVANSVVGVSGPISNVSSLLNELSLSTQQSIDAGREFAQADEYSKDSLLANVTAAKDKFEGLIQVSQEYINATRDQLDAAKRTSSQLYDLEKAFAFGTTEEKRRLNRDIGLAKRVAEQGTSSVLSKDLPNVLRIFEQFGDLEVTKGKTGTQAIGDILVQQRTQQKRLITGDPNAKLTQKEEALTRAQATPEIERLSKKILEIQEAERKARDAINQAEAENNKLFGIAAKELHTAAKLLANPDAVNENKNVGAPAPEQINKRVRFAEVKESNRFALEQKALSFNKDLSSASSSGGRGRGGNGFKAQKEFAKRKQQLEAQKQVEKLAQDLIITDDDRKRAGFNTKNLSKEQKLNQDQMIRQKFASDLVNMARSGKASQPTLENGGISRKELDRQQQKNIAEKYGNMNSLREKPKTLPPAVNKPSATNTTVDDNNQASISVEQSFSPIEVYARIVNDPKMSEDAVKKALLASSQRLEQMSMGAPQFG